MPPGAPVALGGMFMEEGGKSDFRTYVSPAPAAAAAAAAMAQTPGEEECMDDDAWEDASDEDGASLTVGGQPVTVADARAAWEAADHSLWDAAIAVYHSTFLAALRQLGFRGAVEDGALGPVVRRRALPREATTLSRAPPLPLCLPRMLPQPQSGGRAKKLVQQRL